MSKRSDMRRLAHEKLQKKGKIPDKISPKIDKAPSMVRGFLFIFLGTLVTLFFISAGQFMVGIFVGSPFIIIGSYRINKATMIKSKRDSRSVDFSEDTEN